MITIGIIGANGLVGRAIVQSLEKLDYEDDDKYRFLFYGSQDGIVQFNKYDRQIKKYNNKILHFLDYCILAVDNDTSKDIYKYAVDNKLNLIIIDNSSEFRMCDNILLCIPEINAHKISRINYLPYLIANPNCVTTLLCMCLKPLLDLANIKRIVLSTYQAASGAGYKGLQELILQTKEITTKVNITTDFWKKQYIHNVFSHNTKINSDNLYNDEELKIIKETKKILDINPKITATCIRVPTLRSHCISVNIEFDKELQKDDILDRLKNFSGIQILDDNDNNQFPEPIITYNKTDVYIGRIRSDIDDNTCWNFFISGDQLLKGAGYNSGQILDYLLKRF